MAEDWIRAGRCRRVIVISADDITSDHLIEWFGAGFLASGAAATDDVVEDAAIPFDRSRHGMIMGMGAAALVVESAEAAAERGMRPICEVLGAVTANSAFHGTRLDVDHIRNVMEELVRQAEARSGMPARAVARPTWCFVSHETYTPARGGSAAAEIHALRGVFGEAADRIVIANTKGFTGHAMGTGIEDVVAVKALETGCVPPVANFKEIDPELGALNLSQGGAYPVEYALRLGAGFGSQISMTLLRWVAAASGARPSPERSGLSATHRRPGGVAARGSTASRGIRRTGGGAADPARARCRREAAPLPAAAGDRRAGGRKRRWWQSAPAPKRPSPWRRRPAAVRRPAAATRCSERILHLVAEKTGYPTDMLDLDLDLEADLGVDTVKQAEMFAAIREAYNIPRDPESEAARFPDPGARDPVRVRPAARPEVRPPPRLPRAGAAAARQRTPVRQKLLDLVAEKTGYPKDMLDLDLDLEADLGVDTVKQAEMFAAIRETYNIPRDPNLKLRDFPTLARVIQFVYDHRPDLKAAASPGLSAGGSNAAVADAGAVEELLDLVAEKTGYPKDMLDLDLDLEADLGVDTVKQAEMFAAIRETYNIPRDPNLKLRDFPTLAHVIQFVYDHRPDLKPRQRLRRTAGARVSPRAATRRLTTPSARKCSTSSPRKPAIPRTCWISISTWKPTSASTP